MALTISITKNRKNISYDEDNSIYFDDDAYYWYLYPTLIQEVKNKTGELLDLYDDAKFSGKELIILQELLNNYLNEINNIKDKTWQVYIGTQVHPTKKEIYKVLIKKDLEQKIKKFIALVSKAIEQGEKIICQGD